MQFNKAGRWFRAAGGLTLPLLLMACVTGPDYRRPELNPPAAYKSATDAEQAQPGLAEDWWRLFDDPDLDALMQEALSSNLDLKAAMARVEQSRAAARSVHSSFYPEVTLAPSAVRSRTPGVSVQEDRDALSQVNSVVSQVSTLVNQIGLLTEGGTSGAGSGAPTSTTGVTASAGSTTGNRFQIPFDLSYEADIWGRVRRSYEAAGAQARASEYDWEGVRLTLLADLARDYFNLRAFDEQYRILTRNLDLYQEQVELTGNQFKAGLISETSLLQATVQLESTRAQAADTLRQRTDLEHAIALLLGRAPADFSLEPRPLHGTPPAIPGGLPSDLLRRRPDVAEAEQNLIAACAEIGVAKADFFPSVRLTGSAGYQSSEMKGILDWHNVAWSLGPSISLPVFRGGELRANLEKAKARYQELDALYRNQVLIAFVDVEDSLTDLHMRGAAAASQAKAVEAAREYLRLTQIEYQTGLTDYLHVVNAEQTLLSNELSDIQILNQRMVSSVLLIKALGGGWDSEPQAPEPSGALSAGVAAERDLADPAHVADRPH